MHYVFFIVGSLFGMFGVLGWLIARTSIHEIQGAVLLLISSVLLSAGAIVAAIERARKSAEMRDPIPPKPSTP